MPNSSLKGRQTDPVSASQCVWSLQEAMARLRLKPWVWRDGLQLVLTAHPQRPFSKFPLVGDPDVLACNMLKTTPASRLL